MDVRLEPCTDRDLRQLQRWVDSPRLLALWAGPSFHWPLARGQLRRYLHASQEPHSRQRVYRAVDARTGLWVGHLDLSDIDQRRGTAWIGRVLVGDPALRGRGIGPAMIGRVLDVAFDELALTRVELHVAEINDRARRCYSGLGFVYCGVADRYSFVGDTVCALLRMAVERPAWATRRDGHETGIAQDERTGTVPGDGAGGGGEGSFGAPGEAAGSDHVGPAASTPPMSAPS
jgi:RimJ/RimL family protein N-acetyltransferase